MRRIRVDVLGGGDPLMPIGQIRQVFDYTALNHQLYGQSSGFARDMLRRGLRVQARARRNAHAVTGRLRASIEVATQPRVVNGVSTFAIVVGSNLDYAAWVHEGTGVFGPHHTMIRPTRGKLLVFTNKRGRTVHVHSVLGQKPQKYLQRALPAARGRGSA